MLDQDQFVRYDTFLSALRDRYVGQERAKLSLARAFSEEGLRKVPNPVIVAIGKYGHGKSSMLRDAMHFLYGQNDLYAFTGAFNNTAALDSFFEDSREGVLLVDELSGEHFPGWLRRLFGQLGRLKQEGRLTRPFVMRITLNNEAYRLDDSDLHAQLRALAADSVNRNEHLREIIDIAFELADVILPLETFSEAERREVLARRLSQEIHMLQSMCLYKSKVLPARVSISRAAVDWLLDAAIKDEGPHFTGNAVARCVNRLIDDIAVRQCIESARSPLVVDVRNKGVVIASEAGSSDTPSWL